MRSSPGVVLRSLKLFSGLLALALLLSHAGEGISSEWQGGDESYDEDDWHDVGSRTTEEEEEEEKLFAAVENELQKLEAELGLALSRLQNEIQPSDRRLVGPREEAPVKVEHGPSVHEVRPHPVTQKEKPHAAVNRPWHINYFYKDAASMFCLALVARLSLGNLGAHRLASFTNKVLTYVMSYDGMIHMSRKL